jgi:hypothetical protein
MVSAAMTPATKISSADTVNAELRPALKAL